MIHHFRDKRLYPNNLFAESRLCGILASQFGYSSSQQAKEANRAQTRQVVQQQNQYRATTAAQQKAVDSYNSLAAERGDNTYASRRGAVGSKTTFIQINQKDPNTGAITPLRSTGFFSAQDKATHLYNREKSAASEQVSNKYNAMLARGESIDPYLYQQEQQAAQEAVDRKYQAYLQAKGNREMADAKRRGAVQAPAAPSTSRQQPGGKGSTLKDRVAARKLSRTQRLGLTPKAGGTPVAPPAAPGGAPAPGQGGTPGAPAEGAPEGNTAPGATPPGGTPPAPGVNPAGNGQNGYFPADNTAAQDAMDALSGAGVEAPTSLRDIIKEEQAAASPVFDANSRIRSGFTMFQQDMNDLLGQRGTAIQNYKNDSSATNRAVAEMKIDQSKENRDLELEISKDTADRLRRDEDLQWEATERDFDRLEQKQISENAEQLELARTQLGARYGGFGSGKGIAVLRKMDAAGQQILNEIAEDKIQARKEHYNKLDDVETALRNDRKTIFNEHDQHVTEAYTKMLETAMHIDEKALDEEGDKLDKAIESLRDTFKTFSDIETKSGQALADANKRALDRRDAVRKENFDNSQKAIANLFTGANTLGSGNPLLRQFEEAAGFVPGTIASMPTVEERQLALSWANHKIQADQLGLAIKKFEQEGNSIDTNVSKMMGRLMTSDGKQFRDFFGNPVLLTDMNGTVTGDSNIDRMLYGDAAVGMQGAVNFGQYGLSIGNLVPGSPYHKGGEYDIDGQAGTPIPAFVGGTVVAVDNVGKTGFGKYVDIDDGKYIYRYAHMQDVAVGSGQTISGFSSGIRQLVGTMGNTGNVMGMNGQRPAPGDMETGSHLHFQVTDKATGKLVDPMTLRMGEGNYFSGKVTWVDQQRAQLRAANPSMPWIEVDQQIVNNAKSVMKDEGGHTNWKGLQIVLDAINNNPMGSYTVGLDENAQVKGSQAVTQGIMQKSALEEAAVMSIKTKIASGEDPLELFYNTEGEADFGGKKLDISSDMAKEFFLRAGYQYIDRFDLGTGYRDEVRPLTDSEKKTLNEDRKKKGLPLIP